MTDGAGAGPRRAAADGAILLHVCCGPCAVWPVEYLADQGWRVTGLWFNPNIHLAREYQLRLAAAEEFAGAAGLELRVVGEYGLEAWLERVGSLRDAGSARCAACYEWRLAETADYAARHGYDAFASTLLGSPYQDHGALVETGRRLAATHGIRFFYADWRDGFRSGRAEAKRMGLYRQAYCGCLFSEAERYLSPAADKRR